MSYLLDLDRGATSCFAREPFTVRHELAGHPLLQLESLAELADSLAPGAAEHSRGTAPAVMPTGAAEQVDQSPGEIVRSIATNDCWIVLPIHGAPAYRELYDALFDDLRPHLPADQGDIVQRQAVLFLATGGSTTPTHIDLEHGLLLHLRGQKEVHVGTFRDPLTAQLKIEGMHRGDHRNVADLPSDARRFTLEPGDGVHIPAFRPHLVHTAAGDVSLSLTIAMRTEATLRASAVHRANGQLRRLGVKPGRPGARPRADGVKHRLVRALDAARNGRPG